MFRKASLVLLSSLIVLPLGSGQNLVQAANKSEVSQNLLENGGVSSITTTPSKNDLYPHSPLDRQYAYAQSGVPIQLVLSYEKDDIQPNHYKILLNFTAGPYWYYFLSDYGPDQIWSFDYQLTHVQTGEIYDSGPNASNKALPEFDGNGTARYANASCSDKTFLTISLGYDWRLTGLQVRGLEGAMFVGPTSPMWIGRTGPQTWRWGA